MKPRLALARVPLLSALVVAALLAGAAQAQRPGAGAPARSGDDMVQLDFNDVELPVVIDTISRLTGRNFIYDDRVRGRVTIVSPTKISVEQAYAVFESVLQVKGFTTVPTSGGVVKIIPVRDAKESAIPTQKGRRRVGEATDAYVTRLIPLHYIDAEAITNTVKPLVSKDAAMVAYAPTNTIILTDTAANIRRILGILEAIDVETYKEELAVIKVKHADASTLADQLSEIYGAEVTGAAATPRARTARARARQLAEAAAQVSAGGNVRILTDERTNSLLVLASRQRLEDIRTLIRKLDVPVKGGGRVHVYYLKNADAEELAETISSLLSGQPAAPRAPAGAPGTQPAALRAAITELSEGVTVTADAGTNSLVIQGSQEAYATLSQVIDQLDVRRPQVLVEALILEVDITNKEELGFEGIYGFAHGDSQLVLSTGNTQLLSSATAAISGGSIPAIGSFLRDTIDRDANGNPTSNGTVIQGIIRATATDDDFNVLSAPHILTSDNEEAEIRVGDEIPIITSRVTQSTGAPTGLGTSVNVERKDIGVTLRVTPQISEGDSLRLKIFQEITQVNEDLTDVTGDAAEVGVSLTKRNVENTVVVRDGATVVIGGLISEVFDDNETGIPFLKDIPFFGWAFKTVSRNLRKQNLMIFLTPNIIRTAADLEEQTIRRRERFRAKIGFSYELSEEERKEAERIGVEPGTYLGQNPVNAAVREHARRYPLERMSEIEQEREQEREERAEESAAPEIRYEVESEPFSDEQAAMRALTEVMDAGYDGSLVSSERDGSLEYRILVGPFLEAGEAQDTADILYHALDLPSRVVLRSVEKKAEEPGGSGEAGGKPAEEESR